MTTDFRSLLKNAYVELNNLRQQLENTENARHEPLAIIGMACRFPGGENPAAYWQMLTNGGNPVREISADRWDIDQFYDPTISETGKISVKVACLIDEIDTFDATFFGISPREARRMDPQQRIMMEVTWEAIEQAGYNPLKLAGSKSGVFVGVGNSDYNTIQVEPREMIDAYVGTGSSRSLTANRLSYFFNFRGPSIVIDTACSSSLVAMDLAAKSLRDGEIDMAVVGGVSLILSPELSITFSQAQMLAPDGKCKTFDASADGYVRGEGAGAVIVKRLSDAVRDGDSILAVVRGTAVNQDGRSNGLTAPNGFSQEAVIRTALEDSQLTPGDVHYVEAHGTGTSLGDPIEMNALGNVYGAGHSKNSPLYVGSVKTNIGHLEAAAGVAGIIKVVLSLQNKTIPPHINFETPSPYIAWDRIPVVVPTQNIPFADDVEVFRAGISGFGFGGTNAHVIIESAPVIEPDIAEIKSRSQYVLKLSARNELALGELASHYAELLKTTQNPLVDIIATANVGRSDFEHRLAVIGAIKEELAEKLDKLIQGENPDDTALGALDSTGNAQVVFLFTGQGAQYVDMARDLYSAEPVFREALDTAVAIADEYLSGSLLKVIFAEKKNVELIDQTMYTQPALFVMEYALAILWQSWGIVPSAVTGHSVGEIVAACIAGVFSLEDAIKLTVMRGRLMQSLPDDGTMVAVFATETDVTPLLEKYSESVSIAAINAPNETVISGEKSAIKAIIAQLDAGAIRYRELTVSHAFHSPLMNPILDEFRALAETIDYHAAQIPYISNLTGGFIDSKFKFTAEYWVEHIQAAVRFAQGLQTLFDAGYRVFLEVGPRPILSSMGGKTLPDTDSVWIPSMRPPRDEYNQILNALAMLYVNGATIAWEEIYQGHPVDLPTYPFQRERYWWLDGVDVSTLSATKPLQLAVPTAKANGQLKADVQKARLASADSGNELLQRLASASDKQRSAILVDYLQSEVASVLGLSQDKVSPQHRFFDLGMDSLMAEEVKNRLQKRLGHTLSVTLVFDYPTIGKLSDYLLKDVLKLTEGAAKVSVSKMTRIDEPIAIVGMGCRFPDGANDLESYWQLLVNGVDAIHEVPENRWRKEDYFDADPEASGKMYVHEGGFLSLPVDEFDPLFFGISPREAIGMDPQQRLLLEVTWEALENAGQAPTGLEGSQTGVFIGINTNDYQLLISESGLDTVDATTATGNTFSAASGRISYVLGLQGPSLSVDTACSSSLVTVHLAAQSLRNGECDLALAGGINLMLSPMTTVAMSKLRALSSDGRCKTFDASADGYGRGEGVGMIVLKRLSDAQADGDTVLAIVRSSAVNQDGASGGLTVPNGPSQEALIRTALAVADLTPESVDYIEAHGTGTPLGDPIEVHAMASALGGNRTAENPLLIGSVKANIGHLEAAAGIAGIIKLVLALQHKTIPPHIHFHTPNPGIAWDDLPIRVPLEAMEWKADGKSRLAGVSSFGFSGTNAHVIIEEAPQVEIAESTEDRQAHILTLSARTDSAFDVLVERTIEHLQTSEDELADIAYTANSGRTHFVNRRALVGDSRESLIKQLASVKNTVQAKRVLPDIAFLFTGQGAQYPNMARELYHSSPTFRQTLDICAALLDPLMDRPLLKILMPDDENDTRINETAYTQPALFAVEYALAQLWLSWGIEPDAVMGHSIGEYVAACLAHVFSLDDALKLVAARGRLMQALPQNGSMAAIFTNESEVLGLIGMHESEAVAIAGLNNPNETVISGLTSLVDEILQDCDAIGIQYTRLTVSHAFHSPLMEPMLREFEAVASKVTFNEPQLTLISNVTGQIVDSAEIMTPAYWVRHTRGAVRFSDGIQSLYDKGIRVFVEIGPRPTLSNMGKRVIDDAEVAWIPSLHPRHGDWEQLAGSLASLYEQGFEIDWRGFDRDYPRRKVALPNTPFERQSYWFTSNVKRKSVSQAGRGIASHRLLGSRLQTPLKQVIYENHVGIEDSSLRLYNSHWLTAGTFAEIGFSLLAELSQRGYIANLDVHDWQALSDELSLIQTILTPATDHNPASYEIAAFNAKKQSWRTLAIAELRDEQVKLDYETLADLQSRLTEALEVNESQVLNWNHVSLDALYVKDDEILAQVKVTDGDLAQLLSRCLMLATSLDESELVVPVAIAGCVQLAPLPEMVWCFIAPDADDKMMLSLYDEAGNVILHVQGIQYEALPATIQRPALWSGLDSWFYQIEWQAARRRFAPLNANGYWLVLGDEDNLSHNIVAQLTGAGAETGFVSIGKKYNQVASNRWQINPTSYDDMRKVFTEIATQESTLAGVISLWSILQANQSMTGDTLDKYQNTVMASALNLSKLVPEFASPSTRLWFVTRGAEPVADVPISESGLMQSPLTGLGRVITLEHPEIWGGIIDLDETASTQDAENTLLEITQSDGEDQIAYRDNSRYVPRLMSREEHLQVVQTYDFRDDASYLITGGVGKLGMLISARLIAGGARHLVLTSRRGLPARATWQNGDFDEATQGTINSILELEKSGARLDVLSADVADMTQMEQVFAHFDSDACPPLAGIIHAAGLLDSELLKDMDTNALFAVLRPKVQGTWVLHTLSKDLPLDFFLQFSSAASTWGSAMAGHYVAANHFQDSFAHYRHGQGLAAQAINWGWWAGGGMVTDEEQEYFAAIGLQTMPQDGALTAMEHILSRGTVQMTVAPVDWTRYKPVFEARRTRPLLKTIKLGQKSIGVSDEGAKFVEQLAALDFEGRQEQMLLFIRSVIGEVLRLDDSFVLDSSQGFFDMGMDSLTSIEVKQKIERSLGLDLPATIMFEFATPEQLSIYLLDNIPTLTNDENRHSTSNSSAEDGNDALDEISEDELLMLLENELDMDNTP